MDPDYDIIIIIIIYGIVYRKDIARLATVK